MPTFVDQVVGDQRQNRPSLHAIPVDDKGDKHTAKVLDGWIKNVFHISVADAIIDHAFEHSVACGYGAWRVTTKYNSDDSFEQDALIEKISNALSVYWGPHEKYDCSDSPYCFIVSDMPREEFKTLYKEEGMPFNLTDSNYIEGWCTDKTIRIAEYFTKEPIKKHIYLLNDGRVVEELSDEDRLMVKKDRVVTGYKIMWYLITGNDIKEEREWAGKKYIPVVTVWGKEINVGGRRTVRGLIRNAKDPQRMYNYWQSTDTEVVALSPKSPYILTPKQIQGHEAQWTEANRKNFPYMLINPDPQAPGWPQRQAPQKASSAMVEKIQMADQEIRDTMGLQKASLGMQSNERSGKAIMERKKEGDVGTFAFIDNLVRSIEHTGRILLDVAPRILDTERVIRLGLDNGEFKVDAINVPNGEGTVINDITVAKYDVICKVGPSFTTQRSEARQSMSEFIQYFPAAAPLIGDIFADSMDWPRAEEVAERLKFILPPPIQAKLAQKEAEDRGDGTPPPSSQEPQPPPSPQEQMAQLELQMKQGEVALQVAKLEQEKVKLEQEKVKLEGLALTNKLAAEAAEGTDDETKTFINAVPGR
jgi:hypothetical protein